MTLHDHGVGKHIRERADSDSSLTRSYTASMPSPDFEEGLYYLSFSPDARTRRYLGVKQDADSGLYDVVILPIAVTPNHPNQHGPTKVRSTAGNYKAIF